MDPLHLCIALGPVAMYFLVLGVINLAPRPLVTTGSRDLAALASALCGFVVVGPMELFLPEAAAVFFGVYAWLLMVLAYVLLVMLIVLLARPRLVIYNVSAPQLDAALSAIVPKLDPEARWAGNSLAMPQIGVHLHVEGIPLLKNAQLISAGPHQNIGGWRLLERELAAALRETRSTPSPIASALVSCGLAMASMITYWLYRDPSAVQQALDDMLRR